MTERGVALFWVQHLLGSGHLRRALAVSEALARSGFQVVLASGGSPQPWPMSAGVELVQLPILRASDADFSGLVDQQGASPDDRLWKERRQRLNSLLTERRPTVVLTEMYPFGRRWFRHEITALLEEAKRLEPRPLVASTVRDVLVSKGRPDRVAEMRDVALAHYDLVLVHGDPALWPFGKSFPHAAELGDRLIHTGFVLSGMVPSPAGDADGVVVSAGGGAVGRCLLSTALAARPSTRLAQAPWRLVAGAGLPQTDFADLRTALPIGVDLDRHRPDLAALMAAARVSVSQAGYNTVVEGLAGAARMVLVPFDADGQDEQLKRARRLAELGRAELVASQDLSAATLAAAIDRAAQRPRTAARDLAFDGAERSAAAILDRRSRHAPVA